MTWNTRQTTLCSETMEHVRTGDILVWFGEWVNSQRGCESMSTWHYGWMNDCLIEVGRTYPRVLIKKWNNRQSRLVQKQLWRLKTYTFKLRMTEYHCLTGYGLSKTNEHCPRRWWHGSSCPALISCKQAFQRYFLSTDAQGKLCKVQGLGQKGIQRWTWKQCMSSDPVYPYHPGCDTTSRLKWLG